MLLQFGAAIHALRLTRLTGARLAWGMVATAIGLMAIRRLVTLGQIVVGSEPPPTDLFAESIALGISVLMFVGLLRVGPAFAALRDSRDRIEAAQQLAASRADEFSRLNIALTHEMEERAQAEAIATGHSETLTRSLALLKNQGHLDDFLASILDVLVGQLGGVGGALWICDPNTGVIERHLQARNVRSAWTDSETSSAEPAFFDDRWDETRVWTANTGEQWLPTTYAHYLDQVGVVRLVRVPMIAGDEAIGWFTIFFDHAADPEELHQISLAEALVRQASLAVLLCRLGREAEESAVFRERNRLAREIHDTLAQGFAGVLVQLMAAEAVCPDLPEQARKHLDRIRDLSQQSLEEARRSVWALRPLLLEGRNLVESLEAFACSVARDRTEEVFVEAVGDVQQIPPASQAELFRIVQEAINNALRHARASTIQTRLSVEEGEVQLDVSDDGTGINESLHSRDASGFGLIGMRDRVERLGGALEVESVKDAGTTISARIPLSA